MSARWSIGIGFQDYSAAVGPASNPYVNTESFTTSNSIYPARRV